MSSEAPKTPADQLVSYLSDVVEQQGNSVAIAGDTRILVGRLTVGSMCPVVCLMKTTETVVADYSPGVSDPDQEGARVVIGPGDRVFISCDHGDVQDDEADPTGLEAELRFWQGVVRGVFAWDVRAAKDYAALRTPPMSAPTAPIPAQGGGVRIGCRMRGHVT